MTSPKQPSTEEYLAASIAAYGVSNNTLIAPSGLTYLDEQIIPAMGLAAVAFKDQSGNIIVAFEGTQIGSSAYDIGTVLGSVDKPDPAPQAAQQDKADIAAFGFVVSRGYPAVLFQMAHTVFDPGA